MQKQLNIYLFIASMEKGGAQTVAFNLYKELSRYYNIKFVVYNKNKIDYEIKENDIVEFNILQGTTNTFQKILSIRSFLRRNNTNDVIISFMGNMNLLVSIASIALVNKPNIILTEHTIFTKGNGISLKLKNYLRAILYKPHPIVVVSKGLEKSFRELVSDRLNLQTIYNPINSSLIKELSQEKIEEDNFFLFVGRLEKVKNVDKIINAYKSLNKNIKKEHKLLIVGNGSQKETLVKLASNENNIIFKGNQSNPYKYMKNAKVFVLMSQWEGFGLVLVEALISETNYIVSSDCDYGPREILTNHGVGILIENSERKLKEKLEEIVLKDIRCSQSEAEKVLKKFNNKNTIDKYRNLIEN